MVGFLCLAVGYVGFVLKGTQLPALFFPEKMKALNPSFIPIPYDRVQFSIATLTILAGMLISLFAIAGAIGTLRMKHWGRRTLIWYAIVGAVFTLAKSAWQASMFDFMLDYQLSTTTQPLFDRATMENRQFFALIVMTGVQLLWAAIVIVLLNNRYIVSTFDAAESGTPIGPSDWESRNVS